MKEKENTPHGPYMERELPKPDDTEKRDMDVHSEEFAARVKAIFGRKLKYGDGPL